MKTRFLLTIFSLLLITSGVTAQGNNKSKFSYGINAGFGQTSNAYRLTADKYGFDYYEGGLHFTSGFNIGLFVTDRLRPRFEFRYSEMKYGFNWSDTYSDFDYTETKLNFVSFDLNLDVLLWDGNKFQLFLSPGIFAEHNTGKTNRNYLTDGTSNMKSYNVITDQSPSSAAGANFSVIAKYKLDEHFGFTLTPGYNYYFKKFVESNDKHYTKTLVNFGFEYTF